MVHRIFPAARFERYSNPHVYLGIIRPQNLTIQVRAPSNVRVVLQTSIGQLHRSISTLPDYPEDYSVNPNNISLHSFPVVEVIVHSDNVQLYHEVNETYEIIANVGSFSVTAETVFGAMRGLETLSQLLDFGWLDPTLGPTLCVKGLPLHIVDAPTYSYRGLLIDTSRHYLPKQLILDTLDTMAMNKLNILHWHMVDEQSWPYQMESHPEIAELGAFHPKMIYTTSDIQEIVEAGYVRGIRVVPEVDMPGHTGALAPSHPEWMSHCPYPSSPVDPTNPEIYSFVKEVYTGLDKLFPDEMVHLGGDEVNFDCWAKSSKISGWMKEHGMNTTVELYEYFETKLLRIVDTFDKTPIVWQEVFNLNLSITPDTIVDVWKSDFDRGTIENATERGFRVILSGCWYLDHLKKGWEDYYECDPRNFTGATELMIGGHASMWGEHVDASNFVSRVWPRASAAAERLWTGNVSSAKQSIATRIHQFRCRMVQRGVAASPTGPGFCPHEVPYHHTCSTTYGQRQCTSGTKKKEPNSALETAAIAFS
eukprot:Nitzschia sp. Nitz4//scaffold13_size275219//168172//169779//NITZ4_000887-RA/size275219-processed-gene-0.163-mRNA-1//-1//CDS//3329536053//4702//frame0